MRDLGVLAVDDDSEILSVIKRMFGHFEVKVDCVGSAAEALDRLKSGNYRTMITDLDMPGLNGLQLARRARELFPGLYIVLFTGNTTQETMTALAHKRSGISEVQLKPGGLDSILRGILQRESGELLISMDATGI